MSREFDQNDILPKIGGAKGGGVAAGTRAQDQDIGLEVGLPAGIRRGLRRRTGGAERLRGRLLDLDAAALDAGRRGRLGRLRRGGLHLAFAAE